MTREIKDVIVQWISLVTNEYTPAVPKAEARFALFKAKPKWLMKLEQFFWKKINTKQTIDIADVIMVLEKNQKHISQ